MTTLVVINERLERMLMVVTGALFAAFIAAVMLQVLGRNIFTALPVLWAMDVSLLCFVWSVFLGSAVAIRKRRHYTIDIFPPTLEKTNAGFQLFSSLLVIVIIVIFLYAGFVFAPDTFTRSSLALGISQGYFYLSIPIGTIFMALFHIEVMAEDIKDFRRVYQI